MKLRIRIHEDRLAVCRLAPDAATPDWPRGAFTSMTRTPGELSIVCDEAAVPDGVQAAPGWRLLSIEGPIPFEMTGVASALIAPLSAAGVSVFLIATFDTDYLLLRDQTFEQSLELLRDAGHELG